MGKKQYALPLPVPQTEQERVYYFLASKNHEIIRREGECHLDYLDFWWLFYNPLTENVYGEPRQWSTTADLSWLYGNQDIPVPERQDTYSMLRYPLIEFFGLHCFHFMGYTSNRHDQEIMVQKTALEALRSQVADISLAFLLVIRFVDLDLEAARKAKPWYKFGPSDPQKKQKLWLKKQLKKYRENLKLYNEMFNLMLDKMFPYGKDPKKNEVEFPLSAWRAAQGYYGTLTHIPDWRFQDPLQEMLETYCTRDYDYVDGGKAHVLAATDREAAAAEWSAALGLRLGPRRLRLAFSDGRNNETIWPTEPIFSAGRTYLPPPRPEPWKIDMTHLDPWALRELLAKMREMQGFSLKDPFTLG
ncbi:hypothetical protein TWF281_002950 [Arthrobotrys megalospora]